MPKYTLTYFHCMARAEVPRLIFAAAGQQYEDRRVQEYVEPDYNKIGLMKEEDRKFTEEWTRLKQSSPTGYAPFLEVDGVKIAQCKVIASFLGKRFGLAGRTDLDEAKAAIIAETSEEFFISLFFYLFEEKDKEKQAAAMKKYVENIPIIMTRLEKLVGEKGYFIGNQVNIDWSKYPKLKAVVDHVTSNPGIAKWLKERPQTPF